MVKFATSSKLPIRVFFYCPGTPTGYLDNPFANPEYPKFYEWLAEKREEYPNPEENSWGGVRVRGVGPYRLFIVQWGGGESTVCA